MFSLLHCLFTESALVLTESGFRLICWSALISVADVARAEWELVQVRQGEFATLPFYEGRKRWFECVQRVEMCRCYFSRGCDVKQLGTWVYLVVAWAYCSCTRSHLQDRLHQLWLSRELGQLEGEKDLLVGCLPRAINWTHMPVWLIHRWKLSSPRHSAELTLPPWWPTDVRLARLWGVGLDLYHQHYCCCSMINGWGGQTTVICVDKWSFPSVLLISPVHWFTLLCNRCSVSQCVHMW